MALDEVEETVDDQAQPDGYISVDEIKVWFCCKSERMTHEKICGIER